MIVRSRGWWCALVLGLGVACGDDDGASMQFEFQIQALECEQPGLLAYIQVTGVPGICPLTVAEDRTVSGVCGPIPVGAVRDVRLVYYTVVDNVEIQLAVASTQLDLRGEPDETVTVEFQSNQIVTNLDDDSDGRTNIVEFCEGTNPRRAD